MARTQHNSPTNQLKKIIFAYRSLVAREPKLRLFYLPYILQNRRKLKLSGQDPRECSINEKTEIVIDGFQGSANSFATVVLKKSQTKPIHIAHHLHSPAQIIEATRKNIPLLLVIREPEKAILSLTSRWPYISVTQALKSYISFYSKLEPYASSCIVSTFEQTTQYFDCVVKKINTKFETNFDVVDMNQARQWIPPQGERKNLKQEKKQELQQEVNINLLKQATKVYEKFKIFAEQD